MNTESNLDLSMISGFRREVAFDLYWPTDGNPSGVMTFDSAEKWHSFITALGLPGGIPEIVTAKYLRAQMLYYLAWLYPDLIKAGELVALTTLELALRDRYGLAVKDAQNKADFAALLRYMVEQDQLTDEAIPLVRRSGGTVIGFITGKSRPSLSQRRNSLAHGDPFDGLPCSGLLELVRDLIGYAYREMTP